jgi:hypothetical protein
MSDGLTPLETARTARHRTSDLLHREWALNKIEIGAVGSSGPTVIEFSNHLFMFCLGSKIQLKSIVFAPVICGRADPRSRMQTSNKHYKASGSPFRSQQAALFGLPPLLVAQPHARSAAVLVDELDASIF